MFVKTEFPRTFEIQNEKNGKGKKKKCTANKRKSQKAAAGGFEN